VVDVLDGDTTEAFNGHSRTLGWGEAASPPETRHADGVGPSGMPLTTVVGVRPTEGRSGSTLLMQLRGTSPAIAFDDRYPAEYRFLSYFIRTSEMITEPFDEDRHAGVTHATETPSRTR
jgi:hypothetical protein